jgi:hypothetical protein
MKMIESVAKPTAMTIAAIPRVRMVGTRKNDLQENIGMEPELNSVGNKTVP